MNASMTTTLERCTLCRKERRAETLRIERRKYASGKVNTVKVCPVCLERRKSPQVIR